MENLSPIIKIEAITLSQKVLDQIEMRDLSSELVPSIIEWYQLQGTRVICKHEGRFFKCHVARSAEIKSKYPQIFIK
jgi:hypothetical protein